MSEGKESLFTHDEMVSFHVALRGITRGAWRAPLMLGVAAFALLGLGVVCVIEWEIIYRVFEYLAGDQGAYWSPALMACTGIIMIAGFHMLAQASPRNRAVLFINGAVGILIPLYVAGVGLLIASILYGDGLGSVTATAQPFVLGGVPAAPQESWLDLAFENLASPLAVVLFSSGVGGLAICNLFVAHRFVCIITGNFTDALIRLRRAREARRDYDDITEAQARYAEMIDRIEAHDLASQDEALKGNLAAIVAGVIAEALSGPKETLQQLQSQNASRFEPKPTRNVKQLAKDIARIEAIGYAEIHAALSSQPLEVRS